MTFADNLVRLRREKGFSQEQLADLMDVSRQAVSKWEAGQTMPDLPKLVALADLFGTSLDALVRPEAVVETKPGGTVQVALRWAGSLWAAWPWGWWRQAAVPLVCTPWAARPLLPGWPWAAQLRRLSLWGRMQMRAWLSPKRRRCRMWRRI